MIAIAQPAPERLSVALRCTAPTTPEARALAAWYSSRSQVRRLWAIDESDSILIVMKIEPTLDGYDALPTWLAKGTQWMEELATVLQRPVHVEMLGAPSQADALAAMNERLLAEFSWREEYCD